MSGGIPVLLITANVGSIFEEPGVMLKIWTEEFLSTISRLDPKFIALHCQEVGGKNYEQSMRHVEDFVRLLMSSEELRLFDKVRVYLDEDFSSAEHFTALGNFYFVHESLKDVLLWDFKECAFVPVSGKEVHSGNIEAVSTKEKAKFPQDFFPECKWSRKGFLRTRWSVSGTVFDLINIHLFHDASNFVAMETFPSVYSKTRRRALEHTLDKFHNDQYPNAPYFLFGDFNFRTDTAGVIKFRNADENLILTLGKKEFSHHEHRHVFAENSGEWLREYDRELEDFDGRLIEFPIKFVPSYPFEEDVEQGTSYMQTRVPAWCDRVLLSPTAKSLVQDVSSADAVEYGIIGPTACMGDHKPVYLRAMLASDAGMINCCSLPEASKCCFRVPDYYADSLSMLPDCRSCASARIHPVDARCSSRLLHAAPVEHDPYTPDSMDSPSPNAILTSGYGDAQESLALDHASEAAARRYSQLFKRVDAAVSPALLKSRLELIARSKPDEGGGGGGGGSSEASMDRDADSRSVDCQQQQQQQLQDWPDAEENREWCARKTRCNSDVSWQRSHVLTQSWIQDRARQGYRSFAYSLHRSSSDSSPADPCEASAGLLTDLVIPRIAIINASNFESNESSVHLHEDARLGAHECSKSRSDEATSGQGSSLGMSEDSRTDAERTRAPRAPDSGLDVDETTGLSRGGSFGLSSNDNETPPLDVEDVLAAQDWKKEQQQKQQQRSEVVETVVKGPGDVAVHLHEDARLGAHESSKSRSDEATSGQGSSLGMSEDGRTDAERTRAPDSGLDVDETTGLSRGGSFGLSSNDNETPPLDVEDVLVAQDWKKEQQQKQQQRSEVVETMVKGPGDVARINEDTKLLTRGGAGTKEPEETTGNASPRRCRGADIHEASAKVHEIEILRSDSRQEMLLRSVATGSEAAEESSQGRDVVCGATSPGKEKLRLKAFRVTERYRRDIVGKNGTRCTRCCCVIS